MDTRPSNFKKRNKEMRKRLSKEVAVQNYTHFIDVVINAIPEHYSSFVKCIPIDQEPYYDYFGRATFFYVMLAGIPIPVYQTGTIMYESAVRANSKLRVDHGTTSTGAPNMQNGPLLGNGCAKFLTQVIAHLVMEYNQLCTLAMKDSCDFCQDIYRDTLDNVLPQWSEDDKNEHGRLIVMRDVLTHLTGQEEIGKDNPIMKHFYRKDIEVLKRTASN